MLKSSIHPLPSERNELDWKSQLSDKSDRLAQHISAFSNIPGGGFMVFGLTNGGQPVSLSVMDMEEIVKKLGNIARNNLAQPVGIEHEITEFEGANLLFIHIPESIDKPVYLRGGDIYDSYKRSAGQTVRLSKQEVRHLIAKSSGISIEEQIVERGVTSDAVLDYLDYDSYFRLGQWRLPETKRALLEALASDGLIILEPSGQWNISFLGAILFTRDFSMFKEIRRKAVRVIVYRGSSRVDASKEQPGVKGYASGFEGLVKYVMDQLPSNEVIEKALRKNVKVYPEIAIREFVANALIHQDFTISGSGVLIEIFPERLEITNPGTPLVDTNRFIDTAPKSRNETLASLMRRLNICEERGSGIDRAIAAVESFQLPAPQFIRGEDYTRIILYAPVPLSKMDKEDKIRACYQHTCLHYVNNQKVSNQSVRQRFNISKNNYPMAWKIISETVEAGLIKPTDPENSSKKFATYIPFWA